MKEKIHVIRKGEILPLQAADILAWTVFQRSITEVTGNMPGRIAIESFNDFDDHGLSSGIFNNAEKLKWWVDKERTVSAGV